MSTIIQTETPTQINQAVAGALDAWDWTRYAWGTEWRITDHLGGEHYVAHSEARDELEVYVPGGTGYDGLEAVVVFGAWRTDGDRVATVDTVADVLAGLGLPEVDQS